MSIVHPFDLDGPGAFVCAQSGCPVCLDGLVSRHEGLVHAVLRGQARGGMAYEELLQAGRIIEIADHVANISAKHEGAPPEVELTREHPSDILDYFRDKNEVEESGDWLHMLRNYLDKHDAVNRTARALTENGLSVIAAQNLHHVET